MSDLETTWQHKALRDYFAASALSGIMANDVLLRRLEEREDVARHAYGIAAAMLAERDGLEIEGGSI